MQLDERYLDFIHNLNTYRKNGRPLSGHCLLVAMACLEYELRHSEGLSQWEKYIRNIDLADMTGMLPKRANEAVRDLEGIGAVIKIEDRSWVVYQVNLDWNGSEGSKQ